MHCLQAIRRGPWLSIANPPTRLACAFGQGTCTLHTGALLLEMIVYACAVGPSESACAWLPLVQLQARRMLRRLGSSAVAPAAYSSRKPSCNQTAKQFCVDQEQCVSIVLVEPVGRAGGV